MKMRLRIGRMGRDADRPFMPRRGSAAGPPPRPAGYFPFISQFPTGRSMPHGRFVFMWASTMTLAMLSLLDGYTAGDVELKGAS